ncbi:MAG: type-F conjugative transfer system protein TraW [Deltaproteobacteria bacterium]|nr:type-F conjugative transfer system protein TraW [Deltaproteobacteria bacterium]MDE0355862.1 type-F conjugative transfer system protein TraW [Deltaproteobacteria bacterium]
MTRQQLQTCLLFAALGCALTLAAQPASAKDLGIRGAVWPVAEPDLLIQIEARLGEMEASGEMARMRREAVERARQRIEAPERVEGIEAARVHRTRLFAPSIILDRDIRAADGTLIAARGARVNPLDMQPLTRDLLFIDGARSVEVAWALRHERPSRIVLVAGRPLDLMRVHGRPFFFDQGGRLSKRLGLRATPSVVAAEGPALRITEVPLEDEADATNAEGRP